MPITEIISAEDKKVRGVWEINYLKKQVSFKILKGKRSMRFVFDPFDWRWAVQVGGRMADGGMK